MTKTTELKCEKYLKTFDDIDEFLLAAADEHDYGHYRYCLMIAKQARRVIMIKHTILAASCASLPYLVDILWR